MADEIGSKLTDDEKRRALKLLEEIMIPLRPNAPLDLGFPSMSFDDAVLCVRYLTGFPQPEAAQLVAAQRGEDFNDLTTVND